MTRVRSGFHQYGFTIVDAAARPARAPDAAALVPFVHDSLVAAIAPLMSIRARSAPEGAGGALPALTG